MRNKILGATALLTMATTPVFAQSLSIDWKWKLAHQCSASSPAIKVEGIPAGVTVLEVALVDHDARGFNHGGGSVAHDGKATSTTIPEGALKSYTGPCPPNFPSFGHEYEFTVAAIGSDGKSELARGSAVKNFSAKSVTE